MRIALLTAGGYPYRRDALSTWCRLLVAGLDGHTFHLRTLVDRVPDGVPDLGLPDHVASVEAVALPGRSARHGTTDPEATVGAALLCRGLLGDEGAGRAMVTDALRRLVAVDDPDPLRAVPLDRLLLDAWRISHAAEHVGPLTAADAETAADLLRHACRALAVGLPQVQVVHCVGGTAALLAALGEHWRTGTPMLVTEARTPAGARPGEDRLTPGVRAVLRLFRRAVTGVGYAEAALVAPLSTYHQGRVLRHGADPAKLVTVPAAADPRRLLPGPDLVDRPSLVWSGTRPGGELRTLLDAYGDVLAGMPGTVLHLYAPEAYRQRLRGYAEHAGLTTGVRIEPPPADHRQAYARAQVTVYAPSPDDPPHRLLQAMFAEAPIVGVDVGPVAETLGDAGVVVPPEDPASLAAACASLLHDPGRRRALGAAARARALAHHTPEHLVRAYRAIYEDIGASPDPRHELDLAIPAPRDPVPATVRWIGEEDA